MRVRPDLDELPKLVVVVFVAVCAILGITILGRFLYLWLSHPLHAFHKLQADIAPLGGAFRNTCLLFLCSFAVQLSFALIGTYWMRKVSGFVKVLLVLPYAVGVVAPAFALYVFISPALGPLNFSVLDRPLGARLVVIFLDSWQWTGILLLACLFKLETLHDSHFELAKLERISRIRVWTKIVWPAISGVILLFFIIRGIDWFRKVDLVRVLFGQQGGGPGYSVETVTVFVSRTYHYHDGKSYAAFLALLQLSLLGLMLFVVFRNRVRLWLSNE